MLSTTQTTQIYGSQLGNGVPLSLVYSDVDARRGVSSKSTSDTETDRVPAELRQAPRYPLHLSLLLPAPESAIHDSESRF